MYKAIPSIVFICGVLLAADAGIALRQPDRSGRHDGGASRRIVRETPFGTPIRIRIAPLHCSATRRSYGGYQQELAVTEMLFNFGPRKLMRRIRFEGGRLTNIETAGYGHRDK